MGRKIYSYTPDDGFDVPDWVNMPPKDPRPYWRGVPGAPRPDPGSTTYGIGCGFPADIDTPILEFEKGRSGRPVDFTPYGFGLWLLSDRAKQVMEAIDGAAFEFCECKSILRDGSPGPRFWFADVVRFLDAIDETKSKHVYVKTIPSEITGLAIRRASHGIESVVVRADIIQQCHVFRELWAPSSVLCDEVLVSALAEAGVQGMTSFLAGAIDD